MNKNILLLIIFTTSFSSLFSASAEATAAATAAAAPSDQKIYWQFDDPRIEECLTVAKQEIDNNEIKKAASKLYELVKNIPFSAAYSNKNQKYKPIWHRITIIHSKITSLAIRFDDLQKTCQNSDACSYLTNFIDKEEKGFREELRAHARKELVLPFQSMFEYMVDKDLKTLPLMVFVLQRKPSLDVLQDLNMQDLNMQGKELTVQNIQNTEWFATQYLSPSFTASFENLCLATMTHAAVSYSEIDECNPDRILYFESAEKSLKARSFDKATVAYLRTLVIKSK